MADPDPEPSSRTLPPFSLAEEKLDSMILRVLMDVLPDQIYFKDCKSRFVRNNADHAKTLGAPSPEACVGKSDYDFFAAEHADRAYRDEQEIIRTGKSIIGQVEHITRLDGTEFWGSATKMIWRAPDGTVLGTFGITRDITALKLAEEKLTQERNLLRTIIDHLPSRIFVKDREARYLINNTSHLETIGCPTQEAARGKTALDFFSNERGKQAVADDMEVLQQGKRLINLEKSDFAMGSPRWSLTTKVPLHDSKGEVVGLVGISHDITERKRTEQELQQRTEVMEADLHVARQIQEAFFPQKYPVFPRGVPQDASELQFAHRYIAATTLGGDFFDIVQLSDSRCAVVICDVMGHGVRAGLLTALIRGVVEEMSGRTDSPHQVISEINHVLMPIVNKTGQPVFATAFYGVINLGERTLSYANAGHPPPLLLRSATPVPIRLELATPEPAAGLVEDFSFTSHTVPFESGDRILAFTDGLFEASNAQGEMYGEERLGGFLASHSHLTGQELLNAIVNEVIAFTGHNTFEDDLCAVVITSSGNTCAMRPALTYEI
ncbi:MAG: SpoIIE family protein phosphatase [Opitutaceae bacterium]|nr:SpoIIE family protein phosphatase [Opitutaceae bacterium]